MYTGSALCGVPAKSAKLFPPVLLRPQLFPIYSYIFPQKKLKQTQCFANLTLCSGQQSCVRGLILGPVSCQASRWFLPKTHDQVTQIFSLDQITSFRSFLVPLKANMKMTAITLSVAIRYCHLLAWHAQCSLSVVLVLESICHTWPSAWGAV